jgi:hypothetical protein
MTSVVVGKQEVEEAVGKRMKSGFGMPEVLEAMGLTSVVGLQERHRWRQCPMGSLGSR